MRFDSGTFRRGRSVAPGISGDFLRGKSVEVIKSGDLLQAAGLPFGVSVTSVETNNCSSTGSMQGTDSVQRSDTGMSKDKKHGTYSPNVIT